MMIQLNRIIDCCEITSATIDLGHDRRMSMMSSIGFLRCCTARWNRGFSLSSDHDDRWMCGGVSIPDRMAGAMLAITRSSKALEAAPSFAMSTSP